MVKEKVIRIEEDIYKKIEKYAKEDNRSINNMIETILILYIKEKEKEK